MYPGVTCALTHRSAWELLVATILSAQSTDVRVNMVTPGLFEKYPTVQDFAALQPEQLQPDIYSTGFFRNKSKSVVGAARKVVADFGGNVPQTMDELLSLPGVARKTANVVLGTWFKKNEGVVVDTHVTRISRRLELTKTPWVQVLRTNRRDLDPLFFAIYGDVIYHHGAGFRTGELSPVDRASAPKPLLAGTPGRSLARPLNALRWRLWERRVRRRHLERSNALYERIRSGDESWLSELRGEPERV